MAAHGSRTFMAHAGREVTALRYAAPDDFTARHACHAGILFSADSAGAVRAWRVATDGARAPFAEVQALRVDLSRFSPSLLPWARPLASPAPAAKGDWGGGYDPRGTDPRVDVAPVPLAPPLPRALAALRIDYCAPRAAGGAGGALLALGTSAGQICVIDLDDLRIEGAQPEVPPCPPAPLHPPGPAQPRGREFPGTPRRPVRPLLVESGPPVRRIGAVASLPARPKRGIFRVAARRRPAAPRAPRGPTRARGVRLWRRGTQATCRHSGRSRRPRSRSQCAPSSRTRRVPSPALRRTRQCDGGAFDNRQEVPVGGGEEGLGGRG